MIDREKVIKGLELCTSGAVPECAICPYNIHCVEGDTWVIKGDALALLKKQEAKWIYGEDETGVDGWRCSECNFFEPWLYEFNDDIDFIRLYGFCPSCGRKMTSYTGKSVK